MNLSRTDKKIIYTLQGDLPVIKRPFTWLAKQVGLSEAEVIDRIKALIEGQVIRRFGATLYHQRSGYPANVMVAWQAPAERVDEIGRLLASFRNVTHCYQRVSRPEWPYNLYTMVHGESDEACVQTAAEMAKKSDLTDYRLLFSRQELKKTSMRYFA